LAYLIFDSAVVILSTSIVVIVLAAASFQAWYYLGYIYVVLNLYGIASILLAYIISLMVASSLAAFAFVAAGQA
jgi:ATP-binding cassette, subfamily A (ABC1), member 3